MLSDLKKKLYHFLKSRPLFIVEKAMTLQLQVFNINVNTFTLYCRKNLENQILPPLAHISVHGFSLIFSLT